MSPVAIEKLTPERRRQLTRDALVDAAAQVFVSRGFNGASLDEIAETAGFTRGAIYKYFDGKEDLFLAVFDRVNERVLNAFAQMLEQGVTAAFDAPALAAMWAKLIADSNLATLELEFRLYEIRNPSARERADVQRQKNRELVTRFIEDNTAALGLTLKLPAGTVAGILLSTSDGFAHAAQVDPNEIALYETFLELIIPAIFTEIPDEE
jgi:AcrR family transcriptional regulator